MTIIEIVPSLTVLINGVIAGDELAQWQLWGCYANDLVGFLQGRLARKGCANPYADGEEIADDVWVKALNPRILATLREHDKFPGWIYRIGANDVNAHIPLCLRRRASRLDDCDPSELKVAKIIPFDQLLEAKELVDQAMEAFKDDPRTWQILILRSEGEPFAAIAEELGIKEEYARVLYLRGRRKIKAILNKGNDRL